MKKYLCHVVFLAALTLSAVPLWAIEIVHRRSTATKGQGEITLITKTEVTVKPRTGTGAPVVIPANDIVQIEWGADEPAIFRVARSDETKGLLQRALDGYHKVLSENKATNEGLKADVEFFLGRTLGKLAQTDSSKLDEAIQKLEQFRDKHPDSFHFYECVELLGRLLIEKPDPAKARAAFDVLGQSPFPEEKMAAQIALARISLQEHKVAEASKAFEAVSQMAATNDAESSKQREAKLGVAHCMQLQKEYDKALQLLNEVIDQADPEDARVQAEAHVLKGDCLSAAGKPKEAILDGYLYVDVLYSGEKLWHAEALYQLSKLWSAVQQPERAADAADRLASDYPQSPWALKLKTPAAE